MTETGMSEAAMTEATGALLALWNDIDPAFEPAYEDWHANEHVPERLTVPGFLWARRYAALAAGSGPRYLTLYGLRSCEVLESAAYRRLLAEPTPASALMRPRLRNISRWVCEVKCLRGSWEADPLFVQTTEEPDAASIAGTGAQEREMKNGTVESQRTMESGTDCLLARRLLDAAPLPWMNDNQAQAVRGRWLLAWTGQSANARPSDAAQRYTRLPVAGSWPPPANR